jgi:deoxyribonuclease V
MHICNSQDWNLSPQQARDLQTRLAKDVSQSDRVLIPRYILGLDVSVRHGNQALAVAVILDYPELRVVETAAAKGSTTFPYIPGLLSFREIPLTLEACSKLKNEPDLVFVDGAGVAHPRRMGLASHLGLILNIPTIGCAKSHLYGDFELPGTAKGDFSLMRSPEDEVVGAVLRTRANTKPLYISVGNQISLSSSINWVLQCCQGYRLPEPTRLAHLASRKNL